VQVRKLCANLNPNPKNRQVRKLCANLNPNPKNRQVRKLCARAGLVVRRLHRVGVGSLTLGNLPEGAVRSLTRAEVHACYAATGMTADGLPTPHVLTVPIVPIEERRPDDTARCAAEMAI
jgi:hypothetical protein